MFNHLSKRKTLDALKHDLPYMPEARSPKPEARSPKPEARSPKLEARSSKLEARSSKLEARSQMSNFTALNLQGFCVSGTVGVTKL